MILSTTSRPEIPGIRTSSTTSLGLCRRVSDDRGQGIGGGGHHLETLLLEGGRQARLEKGGVIDDEDCWVLHTGSIKPRRPSRRR